jgi:hypothetical protein
VKYVPDGERTSIDNREEAGRCTCGKKSKRKQRKIEIHDGGRAMKDIDFTVVRGFGGVEKGQEPTTRPFCGRAVIIFRTMKS